MIMAAAAPRRWPATLTPAPGSSSRRATPQRRAAPGMTGFSAACCHERSRTASQRGPSWASRKPRPAALSSDCKPGIDEGAGDALAILLRDAGLAGNLVPTVRDPRRNLLDHRLCFGGRDEEA